jgi:hypothetical protein
MTRKAEEKREVAAAQRPNGSDSVVGSHESHIRAEEVYRMAAFRIHETANRIAMLANSAHDDDMRRALLVSCERLLAEERDLLARTER